MSSKSFVLERRYDARFRSPYMSQVVFGITVLLFSHPLITPAHAQVAEGPESQTAVDSNGAMTEAEGSRHHRFYTFTDLGVLDGGNSSSAAAINEKGQIAGYSTTSDGSLAVEWVHGRIIALSSLGLSASASDINNRGQVVGSSITSNFELHAVLWQGGEITDLAGGPFSRADAINARGQVVGIFTATGASLGFLWQDGQLTSLSTLGGVNGRAADINDRGVIVGAADVGNGSVHACLWRDGQILDLYPDGPQVSEASAINNEGQIVGVLQENGEAHAFLWQNGEITRLTTRAGMPNSNATSINNRGQIVGWAGPLNQFHAALWERGEMTDLNSVIPADSGWTLISANGINNRGQITGLGALNGALRAFLLTPSGTKERRERREE